MDDWAEIWFYDNSMGFVVEGKVQDADGTIEPEAWVREHAVENFPEAIYYFLAVDDVG